MNEGRIYRALTVALLLIVSALIGVNAIASNPHSPTTQALVSVTQYNVTVSLQIPQYNITEVGAYCTLGDKVTGGGWELVNGSVWLTLSYNDYRVIYEKPTTNLAGQEGWVVKFAPGGYGTVPTFTVTAECSHQTVV